MYLPVVLSLIGPKPYLSATKEAKKAKAINKDKKSVAMYSQHIEHNLVGNHNRMKLHNPQPEWEPQLGNRGRTLVSSVGTQFEKPVRPPVS